MGFGILFFACFLTYFGELTPLASYTFVIGSALILYALYKLYDQNKFFLLSAIGAFLLLLVSIITVIMSAFGINNMLYRIMVNVQTYTSAALVFLMLIAIYLLAKEVELRKIQGWCIVDGIFVFIYLVCDLSSMMIKSNAVFVRLGVVCLVAQILYTVLLLVILFNCYARICYEDDKDMKKETTGMPVFDFLNKIFNKVTNKNKNNSPKDKGDK
ncbi:MAG: hypothetical protein IJ039_09980 [Clostridia bacterium]|nr:hypothetical protein [Clostridia bacterium]